MKRRFTVLLFLCICEQFAAAQSDIWQNKSLPDSVRFAAGLNWVRSEQEKGLPAAIDAVLQIKDEAFRLQNLRWYLRTSDMAIRLQAALDETDPLPIFIDLYKAAEKSNIPEAKAYWAFRVGQIYGSYDSYSIAINYHLISLDYYQNTDDKFMLGLIYRDLNYIHAMTGEIDKCIETGLAGITIAKELNDTLSLVQYYVRNAEMYLLINEPEKAYIELTLANNYVENYPMPWLYNYYLMTLANYYKHIEDFKTELSIRQQVLDNSTKEQAPGILSEYHSTLAQVYLSLGNIQEAIRLGEIALELANEDTLTVADKIMSLSVLYPAYAKSGDYEKAYSALILHEKQNIKIRGLEQIVLINQQVGNFKIRQQEISDSLSQAKEDLILQLKNDAEISSEKTQRNIGIVASVGLLFIAGFLVLGNRRKKRNNVNLHEQMEIIREQKNDIVDSIKYAKRIQAGILPSSNSLKSKFDDSFVWYQPKDIVSGDFYWTYQLENSKAFLIAVADCTGHGVPGAMVSVICNMALNRSVKEFKLTEPNQILDKTREIIVAEFEKSGDDVKDGMDISLCLFNEDRLTFSGANNPLWIIRENELIELKADKQPVGKYLNPKPFTAKHFELQNGDAIYLLSDGFADQFGGENGKKYKAQQLRNALLEIADQSMQKQKELIHQNFENWKGQLEQLDDVCVIGLRI